MEFRQLGKTDIRVSLVSLGTMTYGDQTSPDDAFQQMDYAVDCGINFFDTAELYAIPPKAETCGRTEEIIGDWLQKRGRRDDIVIASKIVGPGMAWIRSGVASHDKTAVDAAIAGSLARMKTDYIDLYQIHWPLRPVNIFGKLGYDQVAVTGRERDRMLETLRALDDAMKAGKIRAIGLSNETPWGVMTWLDLAREAGLARVVSIQNPYSLINRTFEIGLAEIALQEKVGLLSYAPVGAGSLTGKYLGGQKPPGSRFAHDSRPSRYQRPEAETAIRAYLDIARKHGIDPIHMAIAFVNSRAFITSTIIGATTIAQLKHNLPGCMMTLAPEVLADIEAVHARQPNPCP